jgi:hypothetical protein
MQKIITNLDISPIHFFKDNIDTNLIDISSITPFDLEKTAKEAIEKEKFEERHLKIDSISKSAKKKVENKIPVASKRGHSRQISFNIASSQYMVSENLDSTSFHKKNISAMKIEPLEEMIIKKNSNLHKKLGELITKNKGLELNVNFVINKIGKDKFTFLIECIEQSENPFEFIATSEVAQKICGKDFPSVVSMLKKIILNALSSSNGVK